MRAWSGPRRPGPWIIAGDLLIMSGAVTDWAAMSALCSDRRFRLASALAVSLLAHGLLLSWPVSLSTGGEPGAAAPVVYALRVSLNPMAESKVNLVQEDGVPAKTDAPPATGSGQDKAKDAPRGEQSTQDAIPPHGYYPVGRLSRMPVGIGGFDIQPPAGGDTGIGGKMTIRVWISAKGGIDSVRVLASALPAAYAEAALAAFKNMRFEPGEINGVQVQSWVDVVIEYADFRREAAQAAVADQ